MSVGRKVRVLDSGSGRWVTRVMKDGVIKDGGRWWNVEREGGEYVIGTQADGPYTRSMYHGGSGRRKKNPTKAQRRAKARTTARKRGIVAAVKQLLKKTNPAAMISGASVVKLKGGGLTIRPIKASRGRK